MSDKMREELDWPEDARFSVLDDPDPHKPCWLIMPGGAMLSFNHHAKNGVDQARAQFVADACNAALAEQPVQDAEGRVYALIRPPEARDKMSATFIAWAKGAGLIYESHGLRSVAQGAEVAWLAWQAARAQSAQPFQARVQPWMLECFGEAIAKDRAERNHRFLEEALELVQSCGCTASEAHQLVDYVFGRPVGEPRQESGGVSVTHAALCLANGIDMHEAAETELARIWTKVEAIRAKQAAKPKHSPLPQQPGNGGVVEVSDELKARAAAMMQLAQSEAVALKGVGRITGDGWKDTTTVGEVVFVWNAELPEPYAPGQFPRIGCPIWSASTHQYDFKPASANELRQFVEERLAGPKKAR